MPMSSSMSCLLGWVRNSYFSLVLACRNWVFYRLEFVMHIQLKNFIAHGCNFGFTLIQKTSLRARMFCANPYKPIHILVVDLWRNDEDNKKSSEKEFWFN